MVNKDIQESAVQPASSAGHRQSYQSALIDALRQNDYTLTLGRLTLVAARKFGFCWGVDKAVEIVHDAMAAYPGKRIWMINQMIHNPAVNQDLLSRGVKFIKGSYATGSGFADVRADDVAIIPAFSAQVDEVATLKEIGCTIIDTTCPWVLKPHLRTKRNIEAGFTTVIHATMGHDETRATCSLIEHHQGKYVVVRNLEQAKLLAAVIRGEEDPKKLGEVLGDAMSPDFDPAADLERVALINQTTMLASESRAIGRLLEQVVIAKHGENAIKEHFRDFDTICNATQDNQDAMLDLVESGNLDLMLVVGGFESSNTKNLARIAWKRMPTYHIEEVSCLTPDTVRHLPVDAYVPRTDRDWLPQKETLRVGFTAGASTPDTKLAGVMAKVAELAGESLPQEAAP